MRKGAQALILISISASLVIISGLLIYLIPFSIKEHSLQQASIKLEELCDNSYIKTSDIQQLLSDGANPNDYKTLPPAFKLMKSLKSENNSQTIESKINLTEELIKAGANICEDNQYRSLILMAVNSESEDVLNLLLQIDTIPQYINVTNQDNQSPLMIAVKKGRVESVKLLLESGANTRLKDIRGNTALTYAKQINNDEIISLLKSK